LIAACRCYNELAGDTIYPVNRASYNRIAPAWDGARNTFGRERKYFDAFLDGIPAPASFLDLGCGTGRPIAEHILSLGHRVTGVDQAEGLLALARERFPQGRWIEARLEEYEPTERYAGVICWDALFHIPREAHEGILARAAGCLDSGGRLVLSVGGSEHPAFTDTMFGETFFYDSHPPERVLKILNALGFEPLVAEFMDLPTSGRDKGRFAIVAAKR
jgi:SAM-dependent methyltransferase